MKKQIFTSLKALLVVVAILSASIAESQVAITDAPGGGTADPGAVLDLQSTTKGFLVPRMTDLERMAISNPPVGLLVVNDVTGTVYIYTSTGWEFLTTNTSLLINDLNDAKSNTGLSSYYIGNESGLNADDAAIANTAIGWYSGYNFNTGEKNTAIGSDAGPINGTLHHTTALGYNAKATDNHQVVLGTITETVITPNKINIVPQDYNGGNYPGGNAGDLYVDSDNNGLYYYDGATWEKINKQAEYAVGDWALGGVVFYVDETGKHGLVCSPVNLGDFPFSGS